MKKQKALSILITLALMMSLAACAQSNGEEPADTTLPAGSESSTEESASDEQADGDIKAIDYYIKLQDSPVDDGYDLSQEEMEQLEAIQFKEPEPDAPIATLKTSKGDIRIVFYPQYAPLAVENFLTHAQNGYYDGLTFHRVIEDFMIQGGDPEGNGTGGNSIYTNEDGDFIPFQNENNLYLCHFRGALSMANSGPDTNGSQFFIVQAPTIPFTEEVLLYNGLDEEQAAYYAANQKELMTEMFGYPEDYADKYVQYGGYPALDGGYTVFGMVLEGMDIVDAIAAVETDAADMPTESVIIESIIVENA